MTIPFNTAPIPGAHYDWYSSLQAKAAARAALLSSVQGR